MISLYYGDCKNILDSINDVDLVISDPPYHLTSITKRFGKKNSAAASINNNDGSFSRLSKGFMGKTWDGGDIAYDVDMWKKVYTAMKPGAYGCIFGGTRTYHNMISAIKQADFEIVDVIAWTYGSGFPKSLSIDKALNKKDRPDIAKQYEDYKSSVKPAWEPIVIIRKQGQSSDIKYPKFIYTAKSSKKDRNMNINKEQITEINNHATVKPLKVIKKLLSYFAIQDDITVLDMFAGSGTTAVAIEHFNQENQKNISSISIEMEEEHIEIIRKRCCLMGE